MKKMLVTYATLSGSTAEVAQAVADEIKRGGLHADVLPLDRVTDPAIYDAVVLGAPMIMGWHRSATKFLKQHGSALAQTPLAVFATAVSLTATGETVVKGVPVCVDLTTAKPPQNPARLSLRENYACIARYAAPIIHATGTNKPVSIAFFGGKLDYFRLKPLPRLFVMLVVQARPGDRRNWQVIRDWAGSLPHLFSSRANGN